MSIDLNLEAKGAPLFVFLYINGSNTLNLISHKHGHTELNETVYMAS